MLLSVVIPCHNEQNNVTRLSRAIAESFNGVINDYEIIWVNDGSTDHTLGELLELQQRDPHHTVVIDLAMNQGQTAALMAGIAQAKGSFIATIDADFESHPRELVEMLPLLQKDDQFDMIVGWRRDRWQGEGTRRHLSLLANKVINSLFPLPDVHDAGCPVKIARADVFKEMRLYGELHRFITHLAIKQGARVYEVTVEYQPRQMGQTHYGFSRIFKVLFDLIMIRSLLMNRRTPIQYIGILSVAHFVAGNLAFLLVLLMKIFGGQDISGNPLLIVGVFLSILSVQFLILGLVMEMMMRIYYESTGNTPYRVRKVYSRKILNTKSEIRK